METGIHCNLAPLPFGSFRTTHARKPIIATFYLTMLVEQQNVDPYMPLLHIYLQYIFLKETHLFFFILGTQKMLTVHTSTINHPQIFLSSSSTRLSRRKFVVISPTTSLGETWGIHRQIPIPDMASLILWQAPSPGATFHRFTEQFIINPYPELRPFWVGFPY